MDEVNLVQNMLIAFCGYPVFVIVFTHFFADKISVWQAVGCLTAMLGLAVQALHSRSCYRSEASFVRALKSFASALVST